jgi:hypothetical protein
MAPVKMPVAVACSASRAESPAGVIAITPKANRTQSWTGAGLGGALTHILRALEDAAYPKSRHFGGSVSHGTHKCLKAIGCFNQWDKTPHELFWHHHE